MASPDAAERHQSAVNHAGPLRGRDGYLLRTDWPFAKDRQGSVGYLDACWADIWAPELHLQVAELEAENFGATGAPDVG